MVYYTALPLIMKSENGSSMCINQNQVVVNDNGTFNGSSPSSQQPQLISLQNGDINGSSSHQQQLQNSYTYQLLTSVDQSQQSLPQQQATQNVAPTPTNNGRTPKQLKSFKCELCNMNFGSKSAHTSHMKSHAKQQLLLQNQQPPSLSPSPNASSVVNSGSSPSTTQMQSSDPYQCDVCKKTFAVPARLVSIYQNYLSIFIISKKNCVILF